MKLPSRLITAITGALLILLTIAILKKNDLHSALSQFSAYGPSPVVHIVAFSLKPSLYAADVNHVSRPARPTGGVTDLEGSSLSRSSCYKNAACTQCITSRISTAFAAGRIQSYLVQK